ncbi:MAG: macro domain-containing protein [Oscillospiraceae bacterium]|nr:macro domain-containing protein [Oscillospiraceae bacterium]
MPFEIIRGDITKIEADAVVNAANTALAQGGGVCGAIFAAACAEKLTRACAKIGGCATGQAVITKGYALPAKYIIHTAGPVWQGGGQNEAALLYDCYKNALELAKQNGCKSVAFPLISSGIYGYPKDQALRIAVTAIGDFLLGQDMAVTLVVFDRAAFALSEKLYHAIKAYIDDHYAGTHYLPRLAKEQTLRLDATVALMREEQETFSDTMTVAADFEACEQESPLIKASMPAPQAVMAQKRSLDDVVARLDETFSQQLLRLIDESGHGDSAIYKRANIDRRVFSKIRSNKDYRPSKNTALAFAVALELSADGTRDLLMKAGFALSRSSKLDVIVEYFINKGNYNIFEINEALFAFDQSLLGA